VRRLIAGGGVIFDRRQGVPRLSSRRRIEPRWRSASLPILSSGRAPWPPAKPALRNRIEGKRVVAQRDLERTPSSGKSVNEKTAVRSRRDVDGFMAPLVGGAVEVPVAPEDGRNVQTRRVLDEIGTGGAKHGPPADGYRSRVDVNVELSPRRVTGRTPRERALCFPGAEHAPEIRCVQKRRRKTKTGRDHGRISRRRFPRWRFHRDEDAIRLRAATPAPRLDGCRRVTPGTHELVRKIEPPF